MEDEVLEDDSRENEFGGRHAILEDNCFGGGRLGVRLFGERHVLGQRF